MGGGGTASGGGAPPSRGGLARWGGGGSREVQQGRKRCLPDRGRSRGGGQARGRGRRGCAIYFYHRRGGRAPPTGPGCTLPLQPEVADAETAGLPLLMEGVPFLLPVFPPGGDRATGVGRDGPARVNYTWSRLESPGQSEYEVGWQGQVVGTESRKDFDDTGGGKMGMAFYRLK